MLRMDISQRNQVEREDFELYLASIGCPEFAPMLEGVSFPLRFSDIHSLVVGRGGTNRAQRDGDYSKDQERALWREIFSTLE
jgi:hypothetical protein